MERKIIDFCNEPKTAKQIAEYFGYNGEKYFKSKFLKPLISKKKIDYYYPNKITCI